MRARRLTFRVHALRRMAQRRIDEDMVRQVILTGEIIREYTDDQSVS